MISLSHLFGGFHGAPVIAHPMLAEKKINAPACPLDDGK
jgi:hypothetical protein